MWSITTLEKIFNLNPTKNHFKKEIKKMLKEKYKKSQPLSNEDLKIIINKKTGDTRAHLLAQRNHDFSKYQKDILFLKNIYGTSVAHKIAAFNDNVTFMLNDLEILSIQDNLGFSVAHLLAQKGYIFPESKFNILSIKDSFDWTVAHTMAFKGYRFNINNYEILKLSDKKGTTVAHVMAEKGFNFPEERWDILLLSDNDENAVFHNMIKYNNYKFTFKNLILENISKSYTDSLLESFINNVENIYNFSKENLRYLIQIFKKYSEYPIISKIYDKVYDFFLEKNRNPFLKK